MKIHNLRNSIYCGRIYLITDTNYPEVNSYFKKKYEEGYGKFEKEPACYFGFDGKKGKEHYIVVFYKGTNKRILLGLLGHEVLHLTFGILRNAGVKHSIASEESFTYLFEDLFKMCLAKIKT